MIWRRLAPHLYFNGIFTLWDCKISPATQCHGSAIIHNSLACSGARSRVICICRTLEEDTAPRVSLSRPHKSDHYGCKSLTMLRHKVPISRVKPKLQSRSWFNRRPCENRNKLEASPPFCSKSLATTLAASNHHDTWFPRSLSAANWS